MISALIITWREQFDLPRCLASLGWCDDIHVFDSYSDDQTVEIALGAGAKVARRKFDNYAAHRNAALHTLGFRHRWVLSLDADEVVPPALAAEIQRFVADGPDEAIAAARMRRRDFFGNRWLRHAQLSPYYIRLVRPERVRYEREINEILIPQGEIVDLKESFDHFPFSKGIGHWIDRHNRYSTLEALRAVRERDREEQFSWEKALFSRDFNIRRRHQKGIFYRFPGRPWLKMAYMLFWRRAFLDGGPGITYAALQGIYEYLIVLKERELEVLGKARATGETRSSG